MNLEHPLARVIGLGSAKAGVEHWWVQRLTAVALVPLTLWVVVLLLKTQPLDYVATYNLVVNPINAALLACWSVAMLWHAQLGLQVVIEDYIHTPWMEITAHISVKFLALLGSAVSVLSIVRIAAGGTL
ncbi:MAG: succinate dehydrogenase, hydrophobic membrane anchor protein [Pseudomonadota bacterium]